MKIKLTGALLLCAMAYAQESRGTIAGVVIDAQGAGVPKAQVVITNIDTGVATPVTTNEQGSYGAPLLLAGKYRITAEHTGFKKFAREGITLSVSDNLQIDIQLDLGSVSETVDVTDSAPLVESSSASMGMLIGNKEITEMPLAHGNPYALIGLAPGTTFEGDPLLNRPYEPTHIVNYSMGGAAGGTTDITLDGVSNTSKGSGGGSVAAGYVPPTDAIGEVRIETSSFDARSGQTSGGVVNISLRSGTNKFHGAATFTKMKPQWMANSWFGNRDGAPRGDFDYNRWSGSLSGPILIPKIYNGKNRTFFMWAYEALTDARPRGGTTLSVMTAPQREGDFSELLALGATYQIYDPGTRRRETGSTTRYRQDPFPNNIVPVARFDGVAKKVLPFFPLPLNSGTTADHRNNFPLPNSPENARYWTHTVRIDQNFSASNRFFLRGNGYVRDTNRQDYFQNQSTGLRELYQPVGGSIDDVHTFSGSLVLNVRYGYTRFTRQTTPLHGRNFDLTSLGFPKSFASQISADKSEFPTFEFGTGYFTNLRVGEGRFMDTHSLVIAMTKLRGTHTLDFGFEARAYRQNSYTGDTSRSGRYIFDDTWVRGPLDNSTVAPYGPRFAAFLLGLPNASGYVARPADFAEQSTVWAGYVQDNWRVRRNLTLTLGLRYELEGPLTERYNKSVRDFDASAVLPIEAAAKAAYAASYDANPTPELPPSQFKVRGGLVFAGLNGQSRELWARDKNNFAPRIGLAYTLGRGTVVRAGFGMYFGGLGLRRTDVTQNGFARNTSFIPSKDTGLSFYSSLSNPFPDGILEPVGAAQGPMTDAGNSITFYNPAPKASYNTRWQVSVQRQFRANMIEVAYVGNRSTKLEVSRDLNILGNDMLSRSPVFDVNKVNYLSANVTNPFRGLEGVNGTLGTNTTITRETLLRPYPQFTAVNTTTYQGYAWYHSLQVRAARRMATNLTMNGSFTWAKNMQATGFLNPADPTPYEGLSGADRPFRVTASVIYQLPIGRRGAILRAIPRPVDAVIGGWQLATIYMFQSGAPLAWGDVIFYGKPEDIATGDRSVNRWFNTGAGFATSSATRPSYHYRTWPFYFSNLRRDASNNVDFSINKRWRLTDKGAEIQARFEALNGFNHPQFGAPQMDQFNSAFGQISATANYARQVQAVLRFTF